MDDVPLGGLSLLTFSFLLMFFVALAEVSLATISRAHVRKLSDQGVSSAQRIDSLLADAQHFLSGVIVLKTIAITLAAAAITWMGLQAWGVGWKSGWALVGGGLLLLFLQIIGRALAVQHPMDIAARIVSPLRWLILLVSPVVWLIMRLARAMGVADEQSERNIFLSEDGLRLLLNLGDGERFIEEDERELIDSIFRFSETTVGEVMIPRVDVVALPQETPLMAALDVIDSAGHSRIPLYHDTIDKIVGILYAKDILTCFRDQRIDITVQEIMRPPYFVPETAMVDDLLADLQQKRTHLAIVVDEYGGTAGIVTIEDLLEEIVGEIQDEYDSEQPMLQSQEDGSYIVNGRMDVDDLNRELNVHLPADDENYNTLAGVIYAHLQRVPDPGDAFDLDGVHIEVLKVHDNRIEEAMVTLRHTPADAPAEAPHSEGSPHGH